MQTYVVLVEFWGMIDASCLCRSHFWCSLDLFWKIILWFWVSFLPCHIGSWKCCWWVLSHSQVIQRHRCVASLCFHEESAIYIYNKAEKTKSHLLSSRSWIWFLAGAVWSSRYIVLIQSLPSVKVLMRNMSPGSVGWRPNPSSDSSLLLLLTKPR